MSNFLLRPSISPCAHESSSEEKGTQAWRNQPSASLRSPHSDSGDHKIGMLVMGHSLIGSLVRSHRSLVRFLRTARCARAVRCAHSLAPELVGQWNILSNFQGVQNRCASGATVCDKKKVWNWMLRFLSGLCKSCLETGDACVIYGNRSRVGSFQARKLGRNS